MSSGAEHVTLGVIIGAVDVGMLFDVVDLDIDVAALGQTSSIFPNSHAAPLVPVNSAHTSAFTADNVAPVNPDKGSVINWVDPLGLVMATK